MGNKKSRRYRIKPEIAKAMGLEVNKSNRYRLSKEQEDKYFKYREDNSFEEILHSNNFNPVDNWEYGWMKTKEGSVFVKNHEKGHSLSFEQMTNQLKERLSKYSPTFTKIEREKVESPHLLVVDLADLHIGKYSSFFETGEHYNQDYAHKIALEGLHGLIKKSSGFDIEKIVFVIGNDVLHTDTTLSTTTKGTPQNVDGMWFENFLIAKDLYVKCIEALLSIADVHIVHCPSNHDYMSGFMLADTIYSWFRTSPNITFDIDMSHRKYFQYGDNLLGFSHGDGAKMVDMPLLMANEAARLWADTKYRYVYLHHIHHKERIKFKGGKDYQGVTVEYLRSPSSADSYHHKEGYQHAKKAVEAFIHCKKNGQVSRLTHHV